MRETGMDEGKKRGRELRRDLEEAYVLRDAANTAEEWEARQEHVYKLRAEVYLARRIVTKKSVRRRESRRTGKSGSRIASQGISGFWLRWASR